LGFDLSLIMTESLGGSKYWLLIIDHATDHVWSFFLRAKSQCSEVMFKFVNEINSKSYKVKYLQCDDTGENRAAKDLFKQRGVFVTFKFTVPNTPQQTERSRENLLLFMGGSE